MLHLGPHRHVLGLRAAYDAFRAIVPPQSRATFALCDRGDGTPSGTASARQRWAVNAAPSARPKWNRAAPGAPAWQAELFRARSHPPGTWRLSEDGGRLLATPLPVRGEDTQACGPAR